MSSMNIALNNNNNNNRKLSKNGKRKSFTKRNGCSSKKKDYKSYALPKLQPHKLRRIRVKIKRENTRLLVNKIVIVTIILIAITYWIYTV